MSLIKLDRSIKQGRRLEDFGLEILQPGLALDEGDTGFGTIGRIDHARFGPGGYIKMHPHRDDEILTYVRSGIMLHRDSVGHEEEFSRRRMMLMNAGHTFQHEEQSLGTENIEVLQIFIRPERSDLEPMVQFHDFETANSDNAWRLIAGPDGAAPLVFRSATWVQDVHLESGDEIELPLPPANNAGRLLYVFSGYAAVDGVELTDGESVLLDREQRRVTAAKPTDLVLFTTDLDAPVFKGGMFSGNMNRR